MRFKCKFGLVDSQLVVEFSSLVNRDYVVTYPVSASDPDLFQDLLKLASSSLGFFEAFESGKMIFEEWRNTQSDLDTDQLEKQGVFPVPLSLEEESYILNLYHLLFG